MRFIHFKNIIHRDLKPTTILIGKDGKIKISGFGISKLMSPEEQTNTIGVGTQKYMAPELLNEEDYNEKVDVYSFGVLIFYILNDMKLPKITIIQVGQGKKAPIPPSFTPFAKDLINSCWNFDPNSRPSFNDISTQLKENAFQILELNEFETKEVQDLINKHQSLIPDY